MRLRAKLKDRSFRPLPVRERMIPKADGKKRRLGIATIADRVVQASLKLALEPVFEADFLPCSYGFRPERRTHDAVAEVHHFASRTYEWIVEGDIKACFDEISHPALMDRVLMRVGDKRVLTLVKAFLKSGILTEDGQLKDTSAGTPPVVSSEVFSALDHHVWRLTYKWARHRPPEQAQALGRRPVLRQVQQVEERPLGIRPPRQRRLPGEVRLDQHQPARHGQGRSVPRRSRPGQLLGRLAATHQAPAGPIHPPPAHQAGRAVPALRCPPDRRRPAAAVPAAVGTMVADGRPEGDSSQLPDPPRTPRPCRSGPNPPCSRLLPARTPGPPAHRHGIATCTPSRPA